jgi:hypothetical protein
MLTSDAVVWQHRWTLEGMARSIALLSTHDEVHGRDMLQPIQKAR